MTLKIMRPQDFEHTPIAEGVYEAIITNIDEKLRVNIKSGKEEEGVYIEYSIQDGGLEKGRRAYQFYTPLLTPRSLLTRVMRAVLGGRDLTPEEMGKLEDTDAIRAFMLQKPIRIVVQHRTSARGNVYYQVANYLPSDRTPEQIAADIAKGEADPAGRYKDIQNIPEPGTLEESPLQVEDAVPVEVPH